MKFLGIIPARYASTRSLRNHSVLGGKTVIQRVYEQVAGPSLDELMWLPMTNVLKLP